MHRYPGRDPRSCTSMRNNPFPCLRRPFRRLLLTVESLERRELLTEVAWQSVLLQLVAATTPAHMAVLAVHDDLHLQPTGIPGLYQVTGSNLDTFLQQAADAAGVAYAEPDTLASLDLPPNDPR